MTIQPVDVQAVFLEGTLVEVVEQSGRRLAKLVVTAPVVLDVTQVDFSDAHLGDRLVVAGQIGIERVTQQTGVGQ